MMASCASRLVMASVRKRVSRAMVCSSTSAKGWIGALPKLVMQVVRVLGDGGRAADAVDLDAARLREQPHGLFQGLRVEHRGGFLQGLDIALEDLAHHRAGAVLGRKVFVDVLHWPDDFLRQGDLQ